MINALPFFFGPLPNPIQGTGQTGETGLDQFQSAGNSSDNPFAKILRDQSLTSSLLKPILPLTVQSVDQRRHPDLEPLPDNPDRSPHKLADPDMPVDFLRESRSDSRELALFVDAKFHPSPVTFPEYKGKKLPKIEAFIQTSSIPYASLGVNEVSEVSEVGEAELPRVQMGPSFERLSHEGQVSGAVFSPQVFLAGGPEADGVQTKPIINTPDSSSLTGRPTLQTPFVESGRTEKSVTHLVTISDRHQFLRDAAKENVSLLGSSEGESAPEFSVEAGRNIRNSLDTISRPVQGTDMLLLRIPSPPANAPQGSLRPSASQAFQAPLPFEETPASLAGVVQSSQSRFPYVNGVSPLPGVESGHGKESLTVIPSHLIGDSSLSSTGDRPKDVFETTGKNMGVDFNGGQGVNNGMGGSTHSQPGFQQFSSSLPTGSGARIAEERVSDLPTPPLQRLQMDVQVSETNRIQIDVGVQQRQVYAGLVMDHAGLKNLAVQFVPQLEDQLAQNDMELQEFSAEVRDHHREQESDTSLHRSGTPHVQRGSTPFHHAPESFPNSVKKGEEQGLHLVA
jgi:hypothetical protein